MQLYHNNGIMVIIRLFDQATNLLLYDNHMYSILHILWTGIDVKMMQLALMKLRMRVI